MLHFITCFYYLTDVKDQEGDESSGTIPLKKLKSILKLPSSNFDKYNRPRSATNNKLKKSVVMQNEKHGWSSSRSTGEIGHMRGMYSTWHIFYENETP